MFLNKYLVCFGWSSFGCSTLLLLLDLMSVICNGNVTDAEVPSQLNDLPLNLTQCQYTSLPTWLRAPYACKQSRHAAVCFECIGKICSVINRTFLIHFY